MPNHVNLSWKTPLFAAAKNKKLCDLPVREGFCYAKYTFSSIFTLYEIKLQFVILSAASQKVQLQALGAGLLCGPPHRRISRVWVGLAGARVWTSCVI